MEKYELVVDDEKTSQLIDKIADDYDDPDQVKNYYRNNEQELSQVKYVALEDMVVDLVESAEVTTKSVSYSDAVSRDTNQSNDRIRQDSKQAAEN